MTREMTKDDRHVIIDVLVVMTGKAEDYFNRMDNKRLEQEYDRLMEMVLNEK